MDLVRAHGMLACLALADRPELPVEPEADGADLWPATATACASLSGWLEEAVDEAELLEAVAHGSALVSAEVVPLRAVRRALAEVVEAVVLWGDAACGDAGQTRG